MQFYISNTDGDREAKFQRAVILRDHSRRTGVFVLKVFVHPKILILSAL